MHRHSQLMPTLDPTPVAPPGVDGPLNTVLSWAMYAGLAAVIIGFLGAGILLAISNDRGMGNENVKRLGYVAFGGIVISAATGIAKVLVG